MSAYVTLRVTLFLHKRSPNVPRELPGADQEHTEPPYVHMRVCVRVSRSLVFLDGVVMSQ